MTRRRFLGGAVVAGSAAAAAGLYAPAAAAAPGSGQGTLPGAATVPPSDPRYAELAGRGYNGRFAGRPESFRVVHSTKQVVRAVQEAVNAGKRVVVRSGGHCFEDFVDNPDVQIIIDISEMKRIGFDDARRAFEVEAGTTLGQIYRTLYLGWGVTVPGGSCPSVGAGGHFTGGGYGSLSSRLGLVIDHLEAVEVVVVDAAGRARSVVASRRPGDPHHDLWWALAGGGGGNFGIVTRFWLRSTGVAAGAPADRVLPRPPGRVMSTALTWSWENMTATAFREIISRHGAWAVAGADVRDGTHPESWLTLMHRVSGQFNLHLNLDPEVAGADRAMDRAVAALTDGLSVAPSAERTVTPWLKATLQVDTGYAGYPFKSKGAFLRRPWDDEHIGVIHSYLSEGGEEHYGSAVYLSGFGGRIADVSPTATAFPHRSALFSAVYETSWWDESTAESQLAWVRRFYRDVYARTGGVPVPGDATSGAYINYPDADLMDPTWNTSGVPWHTLYYRDNYPRLQRVKARWDPRDVFRHAMSVRLPGA
ncbi:FAD-dependent oxidoreductase [Micromonospora ureilytica]|uniref:FAD-dependent oxidoreductase n=1 Tax=Micromonospora ureilytica TaxID=709868 RepID=UPI0040390053